MFTPRSINPHVVKLSGKIGSKEKLVYVDVIPEPGAMHDECFFNVAEKIKRDRGYILHGWCIWEHPGCLIEGEFHAVWISEDGRMIDVTPKRDGEKRILFLPDPSQVFDEASFTRRDNIRLVTRDHPVVHLFVQVTEELNAYKESCTDPTNPRQFKLDAQIYRQYQAKLAALREEIATLPPGRNDQCLCGSGQKFKKCCGKS